MSTFKVGEYSVSTIAKNEGITLWVGLYSISKTVDAVEYPVALFAQAPGAFADPESAIHHADEAARTFIAAL